MEIYAELTKKSLYEIEVLGKDFILPDGVKWQRKWGSRGFYLECDEDNQIELVNFLDKNKVNWQILGKDNEKGVIKYAWTKDFKEIEDPWKKEKKYIKDPWSLDEDN